MSEQNAEALWGKWVLTAWPRRATLRESELIKRVAILEAEVAHFQWQPITPENLPKVGDELFGSKRQTVMRMPGGYVPVTPAMADFTLGGWTHFRPINPPQTDGAK